MVQYNWPLTEVATRYRKKYQMTNRANRNDPEFRNKGQTISWLTAQEFITQAENIIIDSISKTKSWGRLANMLSLVSGRRIYEICVIGEFEIIDSHTLTMSGLAKQKNDTDFASRSVKFPCLINSNLFLKGVEALRNKKDFSIYNDYNDFRKKCSNAIAKVLKSNCTTPTFDIPIITIALTPKMMRQIYAAISLYKIKNNDPDQSDVFYAKQLAGILGHSVREYGGKIVHDDIHTVLTYMDWVVVERLSKKINNDDDNKNGKLPTILFGENDG